MAMDRQDFATKSVGNKTPFLQGLAALTILTCATVPLRELVPFESTLSMAAVTLIGLSLIARDGLLACWALLLATGTGYLVFRTLSEL